MAARKRFEAVLKYVLVGILAYSRCDQYPVRVVALGHRVDSEVGNACEVRLASREQVWSRFSEQ